MALILTPDSVSVRKPAGALIVDGNLVADMLQCCHCNAQFQIQRGSGTHRGFCRMCMGVTCGDRRCVHCIPFERKIEMREKYGKRVPLR